MAGLFFMLVFLAAMFAVGSYFARRGGLRVHDSTGRTIASSGPSFDGRLVGLIFGAFLVLVLLVTTIRVVPVGHALVIFNTVTKGFRLAEQGITFVPPFVSVTADYDLRRQEY